MAVEVKKGDIFDSSAQTLVNTVNCVGVMGKGVALGFKLRFPEMYEDYVGRCQRGSVRLGRPYLFRHACPGAPWILNFPTKHHWRESSRLDRIVEGLKYLLANYKRWGIESLAVPPLGAGSGGLDWALVGPTLFRYLSRLDIPVELYAPHDAPDHQLRLGYLAASEGSTPKMPVGIVALASILHRLQQQRHSPRIGRTTFQKLAYFATEAGIPTGLDFERGTYGPFAPGLKKAISALVNNGLVSESPAGRRMLAIDIGPAYADAARAYGDGLERLRTEQEAVVDLVSRISATDQAELAATIVFSSRWIKRAEGRTPSEMEVLDYVRDWKGSREGWYAEDRVVEAIRVLHSLGWIDVAPSPEMPSGENAATTARA